MYPSIGLLFFFFMAVHALDNAKLSSRLQDTWLHSVLYAILVYTGIVLVGLFATVLQWNVSCAAVLCLMND